ncbi:MAG TPA: Zn-dependent alcohol dehydrogenase [Armatimonadota bacterium]|jgi:S-(hydroxymethyl)glutathione dehydrogenase/alcohol dehydrogenase
MPRAAVLVKHNQPLEILDLDLQEPRAREVRVRMAAAGVCHSDLHVITGDRPRPVPMVLGHEGAGVVEAVGEGVTRVSVGDHVVLSWKPACERCHYCLRGRPDMCLGTADLLEQGVLFDGTPRFRRGQEPIRQMLMVGCFAESTVVPETGAIPVPKEIPLDLASLVGCAVTTGVGAVTKTAKVPAGASVAVIGCGGMGLNLLQGARLVGANPIIAIDVLPHKLEDARLFGATHTLNAREQDPIQAVRDLTDGLGVEYAFEAIGSAAAIEQAFAMIRRAGTAVVVGSAPRTAEVHLSALDIPTYTKTLTGSLFGEANPPVDLPAMLELYRAGRLQLDELITRRYRLEEVNEAYQDLLDGKLRRGIITFGP